MKAVQIGVGRTSDRAGRGPSVSLDVLILSIGFVALAPGCGGVPIDGANPTDSAGVVGTCNTTYYNSDFGFGFDLPSLATLERFDDQQDFLFSAGWFFGSDMTFSAFVQDLPESTASFGVDAFAVWIERARVALAGTGQSIIVDTETTLANGDLGHILISTFQGILGSYQVFTVKQNMSFNVSASVGLPVSESDDALLTEVVLSLCVD